MFTVFIFITVDGQIRDPVVQRHNFSFTVADGTIYFCGSFWTSSEAENTKDVAQHVIKTIPRHRALAGLADQTYMHHVVNVKRAGELSPTPKVFTREMRCERGSQISFEASYMHQLEARARITHVRHLQLPRHARDQFGEN